MWTGLIVIGLSAYLSTGLEKNLLGFENSFTRGENRTGEVSLEKETSLGTPQKVGSEGESVVKLLVKLKNQ